MERIRSHQIASDQIASCKLSDAADLRISFIGEQYTLRSVKRTEQNRFNHKVYIVCYLFINVLINRCASLEIPG